jgi:Zinc-binding loop region of homing endonuclease
MSDVKQVLLDIAPGVRPVNSFGLSVFDAKLALESWLEAVEAHCVVKKRTVTMVDGSQKTITCKRLVFPPPEGSGFTTNIVKKDHHLVLSGKQRASWQYGKYINSVRVRAGSHIFPFRLVYGDVGNKTCSHLCHDEYCHNILHMVLEVLDLNKARDGCPGPPCCAHTVQCLLPGTCSTEGDTLVLDTDRLLGLVDNFDATELTI